MAAEVCAQSVTWQTVTDNWFLVFDLTFKKLHTSVMAYVPSPPLTTNISHNAPENAVYSHC